MTSKRIADISGTATTGVQRGILIEQPPKHPTLVNLTVTGVGGKRHATAALDAAGLAALIDAVTIALAMVQA